MIDIHLFDMDAVLVHPGGYRAALVETVNHFSRGMGLGDLAPNEDEIEAFEAAGVTSEWDSAPISIVEIALSGKRPDYDALIQRVSAELRKGEYPAEAAWRLSGLTGEGQLSDYLLHSRNIHRSPVLNIFQQFTLGDEFEETYRLPKTLAAHSTLLKYDRPALSRSVPPNSAIYTARPCRPPRDVGPRPGYAPEAELGARLVGLSHVPIVGFGSFQWLCETLGNGTEAEAFLKPSPVHGLAAIGAALGGPESTAIRAGEAAVRGEWGSSLSELRESRCRIVVFEDSARSIEGVREAVRLLGENCECRGVGIAAGDPKQAALAKVADVVYPSLDDALKGELNV